MKNIFLMTNSKSQPGYRLVPVLFTFALTLASMAGFAQTAYITNNGAGSNSVTAINVVTNTVSTTIPVGHYPFGVSVSSDGSKVYVSNYNDNTISVINTASNTFRLQ